MKILYFWQSILRKFLEFHVFVMEYNGNEVVSVSHYLVHFLVGCRSLISWGCWGGEVRDRREERRNDVAEGKREELMKVEKKEMEESHVAEKETGFGKAFAIVPDRRVCVCTVVMGCQ